MQLCLYVCVRVCVCVCMSAVICMLRNKLYVVMHIVVSLSLLHTPRFVDSIISPIKYTGPDLFLGTQCNICAPLICTVAHAIGL